MPSPPSRQERMNVLRTEHQRRHKQRNGFYPDDNHEEIYDQELKQSVEGKAMVIFLIKPLQFEQDL